MNECPKPLAQNQSFLIRDVSPLLHYGRYMNTSGTDFCLQIKAHLPEAHQDNKRKTLPVTELGTTKAFEDWNKHARGRHVIHLFGDFLILQIEKPESHDKSAYD